MVLIEAGLLVIIVYILFCLIFYKEIIGLEISSPYECGFDPYSGTRITFSYRFYLVAILFIIFDVEISLILPCPFLGSRNIGLFIFICFIGILILGLIYEYYCGSLDWLRRIIIIKS